jgi:hypothetical protein
VRWKLVLVLAIAGAAWFGWRWWRAEPERKPEASAPKVTGESAPLEVLFPRGKVRLPGPLAKVPLDATLDEVRRAVPAAFADQRFELEDARWPDATFVVDVVVDQQDRPIEYEGVSFYGPGALDEVLTASWGTPIAAKDAWGEDALVWFDADAGIRAMLVEHRLSFRHYIAAARLLGEGKDLPFVTSPIIGQTVAAVTSAYGDRAETKYGLVSLKLPPTEWELSWRGTMNGVATLDETIVEYSLHLPYEAHPAARGELLALFRAKWGREETIPDGLRFAGGPIEIVARDDGQAWNLALIDRAAVEGLR